MRSKFIQKNPDLRFIDYSQILKDFEAEHEEKLIEKVMVIAARTKDVSVAQQNEVLQGIKEKMSKGIIVDEDTELLNKLLMAEEVSQVGRIDRFLFKGCPAFFA